MVNITETWYNKTIKEDADIDGYNTPVKKDNFLPGKVLHIK